MGVIIQAGELWRCERGAVMVHDLYDGLPAFMREADCVFVDPPHNAARENSYRGRVGKPRNPAGYEAFLDVLFQALAAIAAPTCFVKIGRQHVETVKRRLGKMYPSLQSYEAAYYRKKPCFVLRGGRNWSAFNYSGMDELDIIAELCRRERFDMIADPCMGEGATGRSAWAAGRRFCGIELNPARLMVLVQDLAGLGATWVQDTAA